MIERALHRTAAAEDFVALAKPGIVSLVLITTLAGLYVGHRGLPGPALIFWTLLGTGLAAAGSAALNNFFDRDIDGLMHRTRTRPLPGGTIDPGSALAFAVTLVVLSFLTLSAFVNALSAFLALAAVLSYAILYTLVLKRRTPLATEIGGIAGALPPVIGVAAVQGRIGVEALILFLIMFVWQPPHFWALAVRHEDDYRRAGIPVLPVASGLFETKVKTLSYTAALLPISLFPYFYGIVGPAYLITASALSLAFLGMALRFFISQKTQASSLFSFSIVYLALLFAVMTFDLL
ncbi:MAG: protoheme IX farnesyltransferase [Nitrospirae bacterium RBG_16_64_22]|nr:MAG: protoheme IX farnesyltransferase [Nitrospirae bacterium RBG_16_64_22]